MSNLSISSEAGHTPAISTSHSTSLSNESSPLQLIHLSEDTCLDEHSISDRHLVLNETVLNAVFAAAGSRQISLITIAGPSRKGKSFFLNFLIRYFQAIKSNNGQPPTNWMNFDDKNKPLQGFSWCSTTEPVTSGIVIWSQPFFFTRETDGQEIAVFLVDTQGTFDSYTTPREMNAIISIGILSSSFFIFNFFNDMCEDVLISLDNFIKYGKLALQNNNTQDSSVPIKPFQTLMFLIRDWNTPTSYEYGLDGGRAFIDDKLTPNKKVTKDGNQIRSDMKQCFQNIDCCLLPSIGETAKEPGFNGGYAGLNEKFTSHLELLVSTVFDPSCLPLKSILGSSVTGDEMAGYLREYVNLFNSDSIPEASSMYDATAKLTNANLIQKCVASYLNKMKAHLAEATIVSKAEVLQCHESCSEEVIHHFKTTLKLGGDFLIAIYEQELLSSLTLAYNQMDIENKKKRKKFAKVAVLEEIKRFKESIFVGLKNPDFYPENAIILLIVNESNNSRGMLKDILCKCEDIEIIDAESELVAKLETEANNAIATNLARMKQISKEIIDVINSTCQKYRDHMLGNTPSFLTEDDLIQLHNNEKQSHTSCLEPFRDYGDDTFQQKFADKLETQLSGAFEDIKKEEIVRRDFLIQKANKIMEQVTNNFSKQLSLQLEKLTAAELNAMDLTQQTNAVVQEFKSKHSIPHQTQVSQELTEECLRQVTTLSTKLIQERHAAIKLSEDSSRAAVQIEFSCYTNKFEEILNSQDFYDDDELVMVHDTLYEVALTTFRSREKVGPIIHASKFEEMLCNKMATYFEQKCKSNTDQRDKSFATTQVTLHRIHDTYQSAMMANLDIARDEEDFLNYHGTVKTTALSTLRTTLEGKSEGFVKSYENLLISKIEMSYQDELIPLFAMKQKSGIASAIHDARQFYNQEMSTCTNNSNFLTPPQLNTIHSRAVQLAIKKCKDDSPLLSKEQLTTLNKALEDAYLTHKEENLAKSAEDVALGIDLGTTHCCVAVYLQGAVKIIPKDGYNTIPSFVRLGTHKGNNVIGLPAKNLAYDNAESTIYDAKRILGRQFDDPVLKQDIKFWPFDIIGVNNVPKIKVKDRTYFPEQISAELLKQIKQTAESYLNCSIKKAVITVPAYFKDGQIQATKDAGKLAGLDVLSILSEPIAAAIAYKLQHKDDRSRTVLIFDLGGGTFDVSVLKVSRGFIQALTKDGDTHLGGQDFDQKLMEYCVTKFKEEHAIDLMEGKDSSNDKTKHSVRRCLSRLQRRCEEGKKFLSAGRNVDIGVDGIYSRNGKIYDLKVTVSRRQFEKINDALFKKCIEIVEHCLTTCNLNKNKVDDIVLVGGSTRIPRVQEMLTDFFDGKALISSINPDEAVAYGAGIHAAILNGQISQGSTSFNKTIDITPMSLGIEVFDGSFSIVIPKSSPIPLTITRPNYSTRHDNQTEVSIKVYQGEKEVAKENCWLGQFVLKGVPPGEAGKEKIDVTMKINECGILHVTAKCCSTGGSQSLTILEDKRRMTKTQIQELLAAGNA